MKLAKNKATHVSLDVNSVNANLASTTIVLSGACEHHICTFNWPKSCQGDLDTVTKKLSLP